MKILHCCMAAVFTDGYSYQENVLPKHHQEQGHDVSIVTSTDTYVNKVEIGQAKRGSFVSSDGIPFTRLPYASYLPLFVVRKLRIYKGLYEHLVDMKPDLIFLHDCEFYSVRDVARYAIKFRVRIVMDCHTDFINSGRNWFSKHILHGIIYRSCARRIRDYVDKFYGTLPLRSQFLHSSYSIDKQKISLLPFGIDDLLFNPDKKPEIRAKMRDELGFDSTDFVIITGGKIDPNKKIHVLINAFMEVAQSRPELKLLLFGKPVPDLEKDIEKASNHPQVKYLNWIDSKELFKYFLASDFSFFPGTHSVLWEEAMGLGIPGAYRKWQGIDHVDLDGNCVMMEEITESTIKGVLISLKDDEGFYEGLLKNASHKGPATFTYSKIAKKALE